MVCRCCGRARLLESIREPCVMSADRLQEIMDWLADGARSAPNPDQVLAELCDRLVAFGIPIWRVGVFVRTLHPDVFGRSFIWRPRHAVQVCGVVFELPDSDEFQASPVHIAPERERGPAPAPHKADRRTRWCRGARGQDITDFVALPLVFLTGRFTWVRQTTGLRVQRRRRRRNRHDLPPLARVAEVGPRRRTAVKLLDTYVGRTGRGRAFFPARSSAATSRGYTR